MKISDFKFAEFFIRGICKVHNSAFVDVEMQFLPELYSFPSFDGQKLLIGGSDRYSKTIFQIVAGYLQNIEAISGSKCDLTKEERNLIINTITALVRDITYSKNTFPEGIPSKTVVLHVNRDPFVWTAMRSIICPAFDKPLKNIRILAGKSPYMDGAKYMNKGDVPSQNNEMFPFIFSNMEIENQSSRVAFLFYETLRAHGMDPRGIVHEIFEKQELWGKFYGLVRASFGTINAVNDFITTLSILAGEMASIEKRLMQKKANAKWGNKIGLWTQSQYNGGAGSWFFLGLTEKLLEPSRGSDWSGYYTMKPFTDELWEKVEKVKKERGMKELPMELLLRIQGDEFKTQPDLIIQGLLADNRVW